MRLYADLDRPWDQAANWLFAARAAISAGDRERSVAARDHVVGWLAVVDDPWFARAVRRSSASWRASSTASTTPSRTSNGRPSSRASSGSSRPRRTSCRASAAPQCQAGDDEAGARTLAAAIEKAEAIGDVRLAALARVHLGRVLRALGRTDDGHAPRSRPPSAWHRVGRWR